MLGRNICVTGSTEVIIPLGSKTSAIHPTRKLDTLKSSHKSIKPYHFPIQIGQVILRLVSIDPIGIGQLENEEYYVFIDSSVWRHLVQGVGDFCCFFFTSDL